MIKKSLLLAAAITALTSFGQAQAAYTVTAANPVPPSLVAGSTTITFTPITPPQNGIVASNFNVINVGANSSAPITAPNTGSTTLTQNITLSGDPGTQVVSLSGTFTLVAGSVGGIVTTFSGTVSTVSGSGYTVSFAGYAPPSPGSSPGTPNNGAISITVIPNNVIPEPASVAMVGLGLGTLGLVTARRRRAAK